jgi:hypothetical protein
MCFFQVKQSLTLNIAESIIAWRRTTIGTEGLSAAIALLVRPRGIWILFSSQTFYYN